MLPKFKSVPNIPNLTSALSEITPNDKTIFLYPSSKEEVKQVIMTIKSELYHGKDGISAALLKELIDHISTPLPYLINQSLEEGIYPEELKTALLLPQH